MIRRPVAVEPVKVTMSTSGWVVSTSPTEFSDELKMLTTPGGMSVSLAISWPNASADHGVSGAPFNTMVLPAASAGPSLARLSWTGKL